MDSHGRVFYIDHNTRTTTWQRPTSTVTDDSVEEHRRQLDRRFHFHFAYIGVLIDISSMRSFGNTQSHGNPLKVEEHRNRLQVSLSLYVSP